MTTEFEYYQAKKLLIRDRTQASSAKAAPNRRILEEMVKARQIVKSWELKRRET